MSMDADAPLCNRRTFLKETAATGLVASAAVAEAAPAQRSKSANDRIVPSSASAGGAGRSTGPGEPPGSQAVGLAANHLKGTPMPLKLGMLGMLQPHAHGLVRQIAEHPKEFALIGFHDPDREVVAERRKVWQPLLPDFRLFDKAEDLLQQKLDGVIVESPVPLSMKFARLALEAGRPVMLEKPAG